MKLICFWSLLFIYGCGTNCDKLPDSFSSYSEAINKIHSAHFKIDEKANTSKSSWIRGAEFFSCDGSAGYFILDTDSEDYIYRNMPVEVWNGFKSAESLGSYYNAKIKHRYPLYLSQK